ncbi:MAG TPA: HesA/MoeB/ThiF family protein [Chitinophagaceae bacterium]|nr:HesA/MoeB/ThiF family protein [Chitinophagaceae bacterium]
MNQETTYYRYQRQLLLKEFGREGQDKLLNAKVLVIGAGGLGCPALLYLTAAGVGTLGIIDYDTVDITNLHRQVLYTTDDIGKPKAITAAEKLKLLNPAVEIISFQQQLQNINALEIIKGFDIVIDGSDNFSTRYLVNDACVLLNKPLVYGAVLRFEGQVGVFNLAAKNSGIKANYRHLFPSPPSPGTVPSCSEAGVLGVLPGIIGTMQANECIKIITGTGSPLCNTILSYNSLTNLFYDFTITPGRNSINTAPATTPEFLNFDYNWFCGAGNNNNEISIAAFDNLRRNEIISVIDVRENDELPVVNEFSHIRMPLSKFEELLYGLSARDKVILFCQSGSRSLKALQMLKEKFPGITAWSLKGGIETWKKQAQKTSRQL